MSRDSFNTEFVSFPLDDGSFENLHAKRIRDSVYILDNSPFYAYGVSYGDEVKANPVDGRNTFDSVMRRGGHSTYRVKLATGQSHNDFMRAFEKLEKLGCTFEGTGSGSRRLYTIDLVPEAKVEEVYRILEDGEEAGIWEFEEAHFFKGHGS